jgi:hypothetical protein
MGLSDPDERMAWMQSRCLSDEKFWRFVNDSLLVFKLERLMAEGVEAELVDHLRTVTGIRDE